MCPDCLFEFVAKSCKNKSVSQRQCVFHQIVHLKYALLAPPKIKAFLGTKHGDAKRVAKYTVTRKQENNHTREQRETNHWRQQQPAATTHGKTANREQVLSLLCIIEGETDNNSKISLFFPLYISTKWYQTRVGPRNIDWPNQ